MNAHPRRSATRFIEVRGSQVGSCRARPSARPQRNEPYLPTARLSRCHRREPQRLNRDQADGVDVVVTIGCGDECPYLPRQALHRLAPVRPERRAARGRAEDPRRDREPSRRAGRRARSAVAKVATPAPSAGLAEVGRSSMARRGSDENGNENAGERSADLLKEAAARRGPAVRELAELPGDPDLKAGPDCRITISRLALGANPTDRAGTTRCRRRS